MVVRDTVRVGVVGAGVMGERHARLYGQLPRATLVGVYDPDHTRAVRVAELHGGRAFASLDDLCQATDALSIVSPTSTHADVALQALTHQRHLLIEKPLCATVAASQRLIEQAAHQPDCVILIGHVERFNPAYVELRRITRKHRIRAATARRMAPPDNRILDTDVVRDLMIHDIDLMLDLFGDRVATIDAVGSSAHDQMIDQAVAQLCMEDDAAVTLIASRVAERKVRTIELRTDDAWIEADLLDRSITLTPLSVLDEHSVAWPLREGDQARVQQIPVPTTEPLRAELDHFLRCVLGRADPLVDVIAGFRALVYAEAISELVQRRVRIEQVDTVLAEVSA
jgi:predicted dehydrogenase